MVSAHPSNMYCHSVVLQVFFCVIDDKYFSLFFVFFFQAEDGIRDVAVTGVQTCALPIFQLVVGNLDAVRTELAGQGVGISEVQQMGPEGTPGSRYCFFEDPDGNMWAIQRSEEHTSELQSRLHLVCRLLLEKKKKISITKYPHFSIIVITRPPFTPPSYVPPTYHSDTTLVPGIDVLRVHG